MSKVKFKAKFSEKFTANLRANLTRVIRQMSHYKISWINKIEEVLQSIKYASFSAVAKNLLIEARIRIGKHHIIFTGY